MRLENVNDLRRQNPGYETQKGGSAVYGSGFPKILFSRVSNLGFHEKLSNEEILTFLLLRHLPKPGEEKRHTPLPELRKTGFFLGMAENLFDSCFSSPNLTGKRNVLEILEDSSDEMSYEQIVDKLREVEAPVHPACLAPSYDEAFMRLGALHPNTIS
jgi:hypothetical protein